MMRNAGIKTWQEAAKRMIDDEVFYYKNYKMWANIGSDLSSVFWCESDREGVRKVAGLWDHIEAWKVKVRWEETLEDKPVLCWVSNIYRSDRYIARKITQFQGDATIYTDEKGAHWSYATPVKPEECLQES